MCDIQLYPVSTSVSKIMCLLPWCKKRRQSKVESTSSATGSNNSCPATVMPCGDGLTVPNSRSLLCGRWLLVSTENREPYEEAVARTETDVQTIHLMNKGHVIVVYEQTDKPDEWVSQYETAQWNTVKTVFRLGEEFDEMAPSRQWTRSKYVMQDPNTMVGYRNFRHGVQVYLVRQVLPSDPDKLVISLTAGNITCVRHHRRLAESETMENLPPLSSASPSSSVMS
jgi:hypothetical protein